MYEKIIKKRTIRLFKQDKIDYKILEKCVDAARLSSSARNSQPLDYIIVDDLDVLNKIMSLLNFGGFISEDKKAKNREFVKNWRNRNPQKASWIQKRARYRYQQKCVKKSLII